MKFIAYHGTRLEYSKQIMSNGFISNFRDDHWLGQGIYFFNEEQPDPLTTGFNEAKDWAIKVKYKKNNYMVIKTEINVNTYIDLWNNKKHKIFFQKIRNKMIKEYEKNNNSLIGFKESIMGK